MSARSLDEILGRPRPTPTVVAAPANERAMLDDLVAFTWPEEFPPHLSYSGLTMHARCPEQWRQRYVERRKMPPKGYLLWGIADHKAIEENFRGKIVSGLDMPVRAVQELFAATLDEEVAKTGEVDWEQSSHAEVKDRGVELVTAYRTVAAPAVQPVAVEEEFSIAVDGLSVPVIGYIDLRENDGVIDRKTTSRRQSYPGGDWRAQARVYQLARPHPVSFHLSVKAKAPAIVTPSDEPGLTIAHDPAVDERTREWIRVTAKAIMAHYLTFGPEGPWPGAHTQSRPPCSFCGYRPLCPWMLGMAA